MPGDRGAGGTSPPAGAALGTWSGVVARAAANAALPPALFVRLPLVVAACGSGGALGAAGLGAVAGAATAAAYARAMRMRLSRVGTPFNVCKPL